MNELALFTGGGGGILGGLLNGWRTRCAVEINAYCRRSLLARQRDGSLRPFPIWDDVRTFDGTPWRGAVDIITGGFPCQDISAAGKGAGITGSRSGLWKEFARIIREVGPRYVLVENSPVLTSRGLGVVLGDLAALGYDARWGVISTADAIWSLGAPCLDHLRERIWIVGTNANEMHAEREQRGVIDEEERKEQGERSVGSLDSSQTAFVNSKERLGTGRTRGSDSGDQRQSEQALHTHADTNGTRCERTGSAQPEGQERDFESAGRVSEDADGGEHQQIWRPVWAGRGQPRTGEYDRAGNQGTHWWQSEPGMDRVVHGVAHRMDRLGAIGNGQTPAVVRLAWNILSHPA